MADEISNATRELIQAKVVRRDDGDLQVPQEVIKRIRAERARELTVSAVPSTPRYLNRSGGGVGVEKGGNRMAVVTLEHLRQVRERGPIFQAIHAARSYQVRRMARRWNGKKGHVGWRVVHKDHTEYNAEPPKAFQKYIDRFEAMLARPAPSYDCKTTGTLLSKLEEDLLTINRPCLEVLNGLFEPERIMGFRPVDGAIIWPTLAWLQKWKADNPRWSAGWNEADLTDEDAMEIASMAVGKDLFIGEFALVREGTLECVYPSGKLLCEPLATRTDINVAGYPPSHVEQALEMGIGFIHSWDYNANYFTRGMMAEFALGINGMVHDDDIDAFADMLREATQGVDRAWQPPILPLNEEGDIKKIDLKQSNREMMYEVWMGLTMSLCTAVYRMDPTTVNSKPWDGGSSPALSAPNRHLEIALAKEEGLQGDLQHLVDHFLDPLARRCHPDLRVVFEYGDVDPAAEVDLYEKRSKVEMTRNEIRLEQGMRPRGFWVEDDKYDSLSDEDKKKYDSNLWNMPTDPAFIQAVQQAAMMEGGDEDGFGEGDEGDGFDDEPEDDGFGEPAVPDDDGFGEAPAAGALDDLVKAARASGRTTITIFDL